MSAAESSTPNRGRKKNEMSFEPMGNRVLVDLDEVTTSSGGLYIPQTAQTGPKRGVVVSRGSHYFVGATRVECPLEPGDHVLVDDLGAQKLKVDNKELLVVRNEDVIGRYKE